jgi:hypothetical protein
MRAISVTWVGAVSDGTSLPGNSASVRSVFAECDEITDDRAIRQGDIFEWLSSSSDPYRFLALVVTADCDIAHAKHRGILSYVPILPFFDYLRLFYLPKLIERGMRPLADQLTKALLAKQVTDEIRRYQVVNRPEFPDPISEQAAIHWVGSRDPIEIADELRISDPKARETFINLVADYSFVDTALRSQLYDDQVEAIIRLRTRGGSLTSENATKVIWKEIHDRVKNLPGDAFFIGCVTARFSRGHVAYLRLVREVSDDEVAIKQTDLQPGSKDRAKRIARMRSPYIFRLTQQLAAVFGAVGLPTEYEDHRQRIVEELATNRVENTGP